MLIMRNQYEYTVVDELTQRRPLTFKTEVSQETINGMIKPTNGKAVAKFLSNFQTWVVKLQWVEYIEILYIRRQIFK